MITDFPLWRDISKHQGDVDLHVSKANGVHGVVARSTISWAYKDPRFAEYYQQAGAAGLYRSSYHVLYPDQPVDDQLANWYDMHPEIDIIPRVIDVELDRDQDTSTIAGSIKEMSAKILEHDGVRPWIYCRANLIGYWLYPHVTEEWLNSHFWWLAHYGTDRSIEQDSIVIPSEIDVDNVILHQTADEKVGFDGETESTFVDWDRWLLGGEDQMYAWIAERYGKPDVESRLAKIESNIQKLTVISGNNVDGQIELTEDVCDLEESVTALRQDITDILAWKKTTDGNIVDITKTIGEIKNDLGATHNGVEGIKEDVNELADKVQQLWKHRDWMTWKEWFRKLIGK